MFVKVCGITNREDALAAIDAGANALGFILHPGSPRFVEEPALENWIHQIPAAVWRVGVFVDRPGREIERSAELMGLHVAQLHGKEQPEDAPRGMRVWKAFRIQNELPSSVKDFPAEAVLLDGLLSGAAFHWRLARNIDRRVILAGGLNENNVGDAIDQAQPWGIDVCSSIESSPGKKDHARMVRFIKACQPVLSGSR